MVLGNILLSGTYQKWMLRSIFCILYCVSIKSVSVSYLCPAYLGTKISEIYGDSGPSQEIL